MNSVIKIKSYSQILVLSAISILLGLSYHPMFYLADLSGNQGTLLNKYILVLDVILFLFTFKVNVFYNSFVRIYFALTVFIFLSLSVFDAIGFRMNYFEVREIILPLLFIILGYGLTLKKTAIQYIFIIYAFVLLYSSFYQIMNNIGGLVIVDVYKTDQKNSLGASMAVVGVMVFMLLFLTRNKYLSYVYKFIFVVNFIFILTIRARAATLALIFVVIYMIWKRRTLIDRIKIKYLIFYLFASVILLFLFYLVNKQIFINGFDYLYNSFFQNKQNNVLSDRGTRNLASINLLLEEPLWGNLLLNKDIPWVHNYFLLKLSNYGVLGSLSFIILYFYLIVKVVKKATLSSSLFFNMSNLAVPALIVLLIVSLAEPTYPYGPGTSVFYPYLLLGYSLNEKN